MAPPHWNVCFLTDIEGNWEYLVQLIHNSAALSYRGTAPDGAAIVELADCWKVVFGGDACDKGGETGGTVRVVRTLCRLKRAHPDRVHLLLGNRDLNKMRLTSELAPSQLARLNDVRGARWVPPNKRVGPAQYLRGVLAKAGQASEAIIKQEALVAANTLASRVRWMLKDTMGAEGEFERRAKELQELGKLKDAPSDEAVRPARFELIPRPSLLTSRLTPRISPQVVAARHATRTACCVAIAASCVAPVRRAHA